MNQSGPDPPDLPEVTVIKVMEINISIKITRDCRRDRTRIDVSPFCFSKVVENTGEIHD